jgi:hypothetical protein
LGKAGRIDGGTGLVTHAVNPFWYRAGRAVGGMVCTLFIFLLNPPLSAGGAGQRGGRNAVAPPPVYAACAATLW